MIIAIGHANMISTQADTSASDERAISKNRRRSDCDLLAFPSAIFKMAKAMACLDLAQAFGLIRPNDHESLRPFLKLSFVRIRALP